MNQIAIEMFIHSKEIFVSARLSIFNDKTNFFFCLGPALQISEIKINKEKALFSVEETNLEYVGKVNKISLQTSVGNNCIEIMYHGVINGWHNFIEEDKIALSLYSAWYPVHTSVSIDQSIIQIGNLDKYTVIKADFRKDINMWEYHGSGLEPCNIIALKNGAYCKLTVGELSCYYFEDSQTELAKEYLAYGQQISSYYSEIYYPNPTNCFDVVALNDNQQGAYFRDNLIVLNKLIDDDYIKISLFGHELGHQWFSGADTNTWEDWLNETGAEWSNWLFLLHIGRMDLFTKVSRDYLSEAKKYPSIRTVDGRRPDGVHIKGCALFYKIYKECGEDIIIKILKVLAEAKEKNTKDFIQNVRKYVSHDVAIIIEKGIIE